MKIQPLLERVAASIKQYVERRVDAVEKSLQESELRWDAYVKSMPVPKDGRDGIDGRTPTIEEIKALIPAVVDGKDGIDGKSVTVDDVRPMIEQLVKSIPIPMPRDGKDGKSVTPEEIDALVSKQVEQVHLKWELDWEKRSQERIQKAIDAIPKPKDGDNGRDAVDVDGFDLQLEGRDLTVSLKRDNQVVAVKSVHVPFPAYQGIFREGDGYEKGDFVTMGGQVYFVLKDNPEGKPGSSGDFQLAVKRGRDGRDTVVIPRDPNATVKL